MTWFEEKVAECQRNHPISWWWEGVKLSVSEWLWQFHPGRNRWCDQCKEFTGNSRKEANRHRCKTEAPHCERDG